MRDKPGARRTEGTPVDLIGQQRPMRSAVQIEKPQGLAGGAAAVGTRRTLSCVDLPGTCAKVESERRVEIAEIELLRIATATYLATLAGCLEQACRQAEHMLGNGPALRFISREQRRRRAAEDCGELPAEIVGVLHAGIEPLS